MGLGGRVLGGVWGGGGAVKWGFRGVWVVGLGG